MIIQVIVVIMIVIVDNAAASDLRTEAVGVVLGIDNLRLRCQLHLYSILVVGESYPNTHIAVNIHTLRLSYLLLS
jgi:hypothetical protein